MNLKNRLMGFAATAAILTGSAQGVKAEDNKPQQTADANADAKTPHSIKILPHMFGSDTVIVDGKLPDPRNEIGIQGSMYGSCQRGLELTMFPAIAHSGAAKLGIGMGLVHVDTIFKGDRAETKLQHGGTDISTHLIGHLKLGDMSDAMVLQPFAIQADIGIKSGANPLTADASVQVLTETPVTKDVTVGMGLGVECQAPTSGSQKPNCAPKMSAQLTYRL